MPPSSDSLVHAVLIGGVLVLGVVVLARSWPRRQRAATLHRLAESIGWQFKAARDFRHADHYRAMRWFRRPHGLARNTLWGALEIDGVRLPSKAGDYVDVWLEAGMHQRRATFSYLIVHLPWRDVPDLKLEPTGSPHRPGEPLGDGEIAFEQGSFAHAFAVECARREFLDHLLDDKLKGELIAARGPVIEIVASRLGIADGRRLWTPEQFLAAMQLAGRICARAGMLQRV